MGQELGAKCAKADREVRLLSRRTTVPKPTKGGASVVNTLEKSVSARICPPARLQSGRELTEDTFYTLCRRTL